MTVLQRRDTTMVVRAAKYPNVFRRPYGTWVEGKRSSTIPHEGFENTKIISYKIRVEIPNTQINRSRTQIYGVGENPLNRKGIPLSYYFIVGRVKK